MSLIHWWPLNGNTNDLGISPCNVSGTPTFAANGKIGKCLSGGNLTMPAAATAQVFNKDEVSICFWLYNGGSGGCIFGTEGMTAPNNRRFSLFQWPTANDLHWSWQNEDGSTLISDRVDGAIPSNAWTHICAVWDHGTARIYANGTQVGTSTGTCTSTNWAYDTIIARPSSTRYYNDICIYNHALSAKEVKEISKGLVLHYNFEDCVNPNLFINSGNYTSASKATTSLASRDGYQSWPIYYNNLVNGTTYTLSVDFDGVLSPRHGIQATSANRYCTIWLYFQDSNYTDSSYSSYTNPVCFTSGSLNHKQLTATRHQWTFTLGSDLTYYKCCAIRTNTYSDGSTPVTVNFWNFKLEKSNTSTAFSTNAENTAVVYDNSGYGNNGTISSDSTFKISSTTVSGRHSGQFDGTATSFINAGQGAKVTDEITVSWWGYMDNWTNYGRAISCTEGGGWNFEPASSKMQWPIYLAGIGYKSCQSIKNLSEFTSGWHLFTGTYDGFTSKLYIDGELQSSVTSGATAKTAIGYAASNSIFIGAEAAGSATTPTSPYFSGNIADIKIYATALSETDVKANYNRKAAIDKKGNLFTGEFIETTDSATKIDKNSFIESNLFATTMTLEDGSLWVPICVHYVPDGLFTGSSNTFYYAGRNIWENFGVINDLERPESNQWEFYVMQQNAVDGAFSKYRFKQNVSPFSATWEQVNPSKVGTNVTRISSSTQNNYAGMYWYNNSNVAMCFANGSNGNWFGCGIRAAFQGGIPGYNGETVKGWQLVYMRISKHKARMFKNGIMIPTDIIEN